ncbi:MAG: hypothetical protein SFU99_00390 [Saprospiraceae bacterium]|nr:hypothetical protein [Saprospiraceae bacterium]
MENSILEKKFSNAQLELLKLFADDIPDDELHILKDILIQFKVERLKDKADQIVAEKGWTEADFRKMLTTKMRMSLK